MVLSARLQGSITKHLASWVRTLRSWEEVSGLGLIRCRLWLGSLCFCGNSLWHLLWDIYKSCALGCGLRRRILEVGESLVAEVSASLGALAVVSVPKSRLWDVLSWCQFLI